MKITIAQLDPGIEGIADRVKRIYGILAKHARTSDLVVFSGFFLGGALPRKSINEPEVIRKIRAAVGELAGISKKYPDCGMLLALPEGDDENMSVLIHDGEVLERRQSACETEIISFRNNKLGVCVCPGAPKDRKCVPSAPGVSALIGFAASSFCAGGDLARYSFIRDRARKNKTPFVFANQLGSGDELIFDGRSILADKEGRPVSVFPAFEEYVETLDTAVAGSAETYRGTDEIESVYKALIFGIRGYMKKHGFSKIVIGISGGIDSAVACALAKEAAGAVNVLGVYMPSPYSLKESAQYAQELSKNLDIQLRTVPISDIYSAYKNALKKDLLVEEKEEVGIYLQNIQARIRGNILMAFSNKFGHLLLATGNRSELAAGYCTLYGDLAGGLAVISDVPKTMVYRLAAYINEPDKVIPQAIISRPPSAELKPGQLDQDTLPDYETLDGMVSSYLDKEQSAEEMVKEGFDPEKVEWFIAAVKKSAYKRKQAPPGLRVTTRR
ncbi:MAG: NAD(+) synthase [Candidatus Omnitrophota bacterium]